MVKGFHAEQCTDRTAAEADAEKEGLWNAPKLALGFEFVDAIGHKGDERGKREQGKIKRKIGWHDGLLFYKNEHSITVFGALVKHF